MIDQIAIFVTGISAIWLSQDQRTRARKYACIFGLAGQPFWFYSSFQSSQWGIMVLSVFYTIAWGKGFYLYWIKRGEEESAK